MHFLSFQGGCEYFAKSHYQLGSCYLAHLKELINSNYFFFIEKILGEQREDRITEGRLHGAFLLHGFVLHVFVFGLFMHFFCIRKPRNCKVRLRSCRRPLSHLKDYHIWNLDVSFCYWQVIQEKDALNQDCMRATCWHDMFV